VIASVVVEANTRARAYRFRRAWREIPVGFPWCCRRGLFHPGLWRYQWNMRSPWCWCAPAILSRERRSWLWRIPRGDGLVARTLAHAPDQSYSVSLLWRITTPSRDTRPYGTGPPIGVYPRHNCHSCVWRYGCAVCRLGHVPVEGTCRAAEDNLISASI